MESKRSLQRESADTYVGGKKPTSKALLVAEHDRKIAGANGAWG
jgi:hypothetical protein